MLSRTACLVALAGLAFNSLAQPVGRIDPEPGAADARSDAPIAKELARPEDGPAISPEIPTTSSFFTAVIYDGASDTNGSAGELRTLRIPARYRYSTPIDNKNIFAFGLSQVSSIYDFQPFSEFPGSGDPIDYGLAANISASIIHIIDRQWQVFAGVNVGFNGEIDAEFIESLTGGGQFGFQYAVNQNLDIGASLIVQSRLEEDLIAFPIPTVDWQFADYWNFKFGNVEQLPGSLNGGFAVTHDFTEAINVGGFAGVAFHQFRLADDNSSVSDGIFEDALIPVGTFITYQHSPNFSVVGSVQAIVWREVNLRTESGANVADVELQPTLSAAIGVRFRL